MTTATQTVKIALPKVVKEEQEFNIPCYFKCGTAHIAIYEDRSIFLFSDAKPSILTNSKEDGINEVQEQRLTGYYEETDTISFDQKLRDAFNAILIHTEQYDRNNDFHQTVE